MNVRLVVDGWKRPRSLVCHSVMIPSARPSLPASFVARSSLLVVCSHQLTSWQQLVATGTGWVPDVPHSPYLYCEVLFAVDLNSAIKTAEELVLAQ
jgi:hypothetical protein